MGGGARSMAGAKGRARLGTRAARGAGPHQLGVGPGRLWSAVEPRHTRAVGQRETQLIAGMGRPAGLRAYGESSRRRSRTPNLAGGLYQPITSLEWHGQCSS